MTTSAFIIVFLSYEYRVTLPNNIAAYINASVAHCSDNLFVKDIAGGDYDELSIDSYSESISGRSWPIADGPFTTRSRRQRLS
jgi:hypothetical protein